MKKIATIFLAVLIVALIIPSIVFAAEIDLVADDAGVLTYDEWVALNQRADQITERYSCDVAIIIVDEMNDDDGAYEWAKFIYEGYDYGYGADKSGVLFFLSMAERDYALIAHGYGNTAFTDYGKDVMLDKHILPLLKDNKYYEAFSVYLDKAEEFLAMSRGGTPFDRDTDPERSGSSILFKLAITILVPLLIALIVCSMWKKQMKTAVIARTATNYIPTNGFNLTGQTDMFLYRTIDRRKVASQPAKSGGTTKDSKGYSGRSGKF